MNTREYVSVACQLICAIAALGGILRCIAMLVKKIISARTRKEIEIESENEAHGRDVTKYLLDDDPTPYGKGRLVLAVVRKFVRQNPGCTFNGLRQVFQDEWQNRFIVRTTDGDEWKDKRLREHDFFWRDEDLIALNDGTKVMVCRQWGVGNIDRFLNGAKALGYAIRPVENHKHAASKKLTMCVTLVAMIISCVAFSTKADTWMDSAGRSWKYDDHGSEVAITGVSPAEGEIVIPQKINDKIVTSIGYSAFFGCSGLTSVTIPDSVTSIGEGAFDGCNCALVFSGEPPSWASRFSDSCLFVYPAEYEAQWKPLLKLLKKSPIVKVTSSKIRDSDPTILDTRFRVWKSGPIETPPTVKIRALAFEDGTRSFAKVVRPETFVDGTAPANWDAVEANVEHTLSWKVSSDWATRLAKVKFEILACDGDLLPLELRTIPASDQYGKMKISWNAITESQAFDALLWLYADKSPELTLSDGVLVNGPELNSLTQLTTRAGYLYNVNVNPNPAMRYIYPKMGYQLLTGAPLSYANSETRLGLSPSGVRQYAYKIVEE